MGRRAALLVGLSLVAWACGGTDRTAADSAVTYLPATTVFTGSFPTVPLTAPTGVAAELETGQSWCPEFRTPDNGSGPGDFGVAERNLGALMAYAAQYPEHAGSPWFDAADAKGRVVIGFTADVASHRKAMRPTLADPDRVLVCQIRHSAAEAAAAVAEIDAQSRAAPAGVWRGWSAGVDRAQVTVRADQRELADALLARYGDLVEVGLGLFPYPMPDDRSTVDVRCPTASVDLPSTRPGVTTRVALAAAVLRSGADVDATVTATNEVTESVTVTFGGPAVVVRAGTTEVVGTADFGMLLNLDMATLAPGASEQRSVRVGTASCDPAVGSRCRRATTRWSCSSPAATTRW